MKLKIDETAKDSTLSVNSQNINYPVTNILDSRLTKVFRTSDTITTAQIVFNAGEAIDITSLVIDNHNFTSSAVMKFQANDTNSWGSPAVEETLSWNSGLIYIDISQVNYEYMRVEVVDVTNPDTYIQMGRVWIGDLYETPGIFPRISDTRSSKSVKTITISGQSYMDKRYINQEVSVRIPKVSFTQKAELIEQFEIADIGTPFYVTFNETCTDLDTLYVTYDQESLSFNLLSNVSYYESSMSFTEEM